MSPGERMVWAAEFALARREVSASVSASRARLLAATKAHIAVQELGLAHQEQEDAGPELAVTADLREMVTGSRQVPALTGAATDLAYRDEGL